MGFNVKQLVIQGYDPSLYKQAYERAVEAAKHPLPREQQKAVKMYVRDADRSAMKHTLDAVNNGTVDLSDEHTITSLMRYSSPNLFTDGVYPDNTQVGAMSMSKWKEYRRRAFAHYLEVGSPRDGKLIPVNPVVAPPMPVDGPQLSDKQWNHILYGSAEWKKDRVTSRKFLNYGGGHMHGYGWVHNGSTFPESWDEEKIYGTLLELIETGETTPFGKTGTKYSATIDGMHLVAYTDKGNITSFYPEER